MPNKTFEPTDEHRKMVEAMAGYGIPHEDICVLITNPHTGKHIARDTLEKHFDQELKSGHIKANAKVAESLYNQAVKDGVTTAAIWWTKARMGWKETQGLEHSSSKDKPFIVELVAARVKSTD